MITVHHLGISQSERILWLMEELELPYELKRYDRDPKTRFAQADYRALHPIGIAPVIEDGDVKLAESGAIIEYVMARHGNGRLAPAREESSFPDYLFWFHFANGTLMPAIMMDLALGMALPAEARGRTNPITERIDRAFAMMEERLQTVPYFAGEAFSAADIMMAFPLTTMRKFIGLDMSAHPHIRAYVARIAQRPAYRRAIEKGDPGRSPDAA